MSALLGVRAVPVRVVASASLVAAVFGASYGSWGHSMSVGDAVALRRWCGCSVLSRCSGAWRNGGRVTSLCSRLSGEAAVFEFLVSV